MSNLPPAPADERMVEEGESSGSLSMADKVDRIYEGMRTLPSLKAIIMDHHQRINDLEAAMSAHYDAFPVGAEPSGIQSQPENPPTGIYITHYMH